MAYRQKAFKRYKEWGRRLRGSAKSRRNGSGKQRGMRRIWYELPIGTGGKARCPCHYTFPCPRKAASDAR